jgi:hypothetical protein
VHPYCIPVRAQSVVGSAACTGAGGHGSSSPAPQEVCARRTPTVRPHLPRPCVVYVSRLEVANTCFNLAVECHTRADTQLHFSTLHLYRAQAELAVAQSQVAKAKLGYASHVPRQLHASRTITCRVALEMTVSRPKLLVRCIEQCAIAC